MSKAIEIDDFRRANLVKLARHLWDKVSQEQFDMGAYSRSSLLPHEDHCGSVGCAVGYGPRAGIPSVSSDLGWGDYTVRCLTDDVDVDNWCFCGGWQDEDNTPRGAAKRILWALLHGVPEDFRTHDIYVKPYALWTPIESDWERAVSPPPACVPQGQGEPHASPPNRRPR